MSDALFDNDSLAMTSAKLAAAEAFMNLATKDLKYPEFARELIMATVQILNCEAGSLFELDTKEQDLFFRAAVGQVSDQLAQFRIPVGHGIVGYVAESKQPLLVADAKENKRHLRAIGDAVQFETRNLIAVPLLIRGQIYGVLEALNRVGEPTFNAEDLELATYIGSLMAKTIEIRLMLNFTLQGGKAT